jgi:hypothetical protein
MPTIWVYVMAHKFGRKGLKAAINKGDGNGHREAGRLKELPSCRSTGVIWKALICGINIKVPIHMCWASTNTTTGYLAQTA